MAEIPARYIFIEDDIYIHVNRGKITKVTTEDGKLISKFVYPEEGFYSLDSKGHFLSKLNRSLYEILGSKYQEKFFFTMETLIVLMEQTILFWNQEINFISIVD